MTYVYQWFGAVNGCAFLYGCMLGMAAQAAGHPGYQWHETKAPVSESVPHQRLEPAPVPNRS